MHGNRSYKESFGLDELAASLMEQIDAQVQKDYSPKVFALWKNPLHMGRMASPDAVANLEGQCGDSIEIQIRVQNDQIIDAKFSTNGCAPSVVSGSAACALARGKGLEEVASITEEDILNYLDGLPEEKEHCAYLAARTIQEAVHNYMLEKMKTPPL